MSQRTDSPGKNSIEGNFSPDLEARIDGESGSLDLDLTANTESIDTVKQAENTQHGTQEINQPIQEIDPRRRMKNQLRMAIIRITKKQAPLLEPLHQGGVSPASPEASTRWLDTEGEQQHTQKQRAKHVDTNQTLKWFKKIGGRRQYSGGTGDPQGPIKTGHEEPTLVGPIQRKLLTDLGSSNSSCQTAGTLKSQGHSQLG